MADNSSYKTLRSLDSKVEKIVCEFLDRNLYNGKNGAFRDVRRITDKEEQIMGTDIIFSAPSLDLEGVRVDEKSASSYMLKQISTFALELSFMNRFGQEMIGWFRNDELDTEYYMCVHLQVKREFIDRVFNGKVPYKPTVEDRIRLAENLAIDDIDKKNITYFLVSKKKIVLALEEIGLSLSDMDEWIARLRGKADMDEGKTTLYEKFDDEITFVVTRGLAERPINLKISHSFYERIAERFIQVKDGKVVKNFERGVSLI